MSTYTKDQLISRINQVTAINKYRLSRDPDADGLAMDNELFAIALASLEAPSLTDETVDHRDEFEAAFPIPLHAERCGAGYCCTAYNAWDAHKFVNRWEGWKACRAAMLQGAEPVSKPYKLPPHTYRELVNSLRDTAVKYQGCQQLREQLSRTLQAVIEPAGTQQEVKNG